MRSDALRNRQRLLEAADAMFREYGVDVGVGEIAAAAGVGRGTLFRNFPSKDALIAAVLAERINEVISFGRELLADDAADADDADVVFRFVEELVARQEENRALLQTLTGLESSQDVPELERTKAAMVELLEALLDRGRHAGSIRLEATAADLMTLIKGLCMHPASEQPLPPETVRRHLDLVRAALTTPEYAQPLGGVPAVPGAAGAPAVPAG